MAWKEDLFEPEMHWKNGLGEWIVFREKKNLEKKNFQKKKFSKKKFF